MDVMEKITQIVNGSSGDGSDPNGRATVGAHWAEHKPVDPEQLRTYLRVIMRTDPIDEEANAKAYAELRAISHKAGAYLTASELKDTLDRFPDADQWGNPYRKALGYEFAASLTLQHIQKEISAIETLQRPLGPRILQGYCREFMDCVFAAGHVRSGFEHLMVVLDELATRALHKGAHRAAYAELAQAIGAALVDIAEVKCEKDFAEMARAMRLFKKGETPKPEKRNRYIFADESLVDHLKAVAKSIHAAGEVLKGLRGGPPLDPAQAKQETSAEKLKLQLAFYSGLMEPLTKAGYRPLSAMVKRQVGTLRERFARGQGVSFYRVAAADYEAHGDLERAAYLAKLSDRRFTEAVRLFEASGDAVSAKRCREKLEDKPVIELPKQPELPKPEDRAYIDRGSRSSRP